MRGLERDWSIPFDPAEIGEQAMFVWCQTKEDAETFVRAYKGIDARTWIEYWDTYKDETIYAIPEDGGSAWMFGTRNSLDNHWANEGYVPRIYLGSQPVNVVEVGDLL